MSECSYRMMITLIHLCFHSRGRIIFCSSFSLSSSSTSHMYHNPNSSVKLHTINQRYILPCKCRFEQIAFEVDLIADSSFAIKDIPVLLYKCSIITHYNNFLIFFHYIFPHFPGSWYGCKVLRGGVCFHSHGGDQACWRIPSRCCHADPPEEGGEPYHRGTEVFSPASTFNSGLGVYRALLHHPWGPLLEEAR